MNKGFTPFQIAHVRFCLYQKVFSRGKQKLKLKTFFGKFETGFTFFEMLVVVTIIGLLTVIVVPNYIVARSKATAATCTSNQKVIYTAATMYMLEESESLAGMGHKEKLDALIDKRYLKGNKWAECPSSGDNDYNDYTIEIDGNIIVDVECDIDPTKHVWP